MIKFYIMIAVVAVIGGTVAGGYKYVNDMQEQLLTLRGNNVKLEQANEVNQATIGRMETDRVRSEELNRNLQAELQTAYAGAQVLRTTLARHDLTRLVLAKPGLIETRINDATQDLFNQLRIDTAQ